MSKNVPDLMVKNFTSTKTAIALCLTLAVVGIAGSLLYQGNTAFDKQGPFNVFRSPVFLVPAGLLVLNILFCAGNRLASLSASSVRTWTFAGMHLGLVLLAAGMVVDGLYGFTGTGYFFLGAPSSEYRNWRTGRDERFPFTVLATSIRVERHPLNLRIGVRGPKGEKDGPYTVREGVPFRANGLGVTVTPRKFDLDSKTLFFDAKVGEVEVSGQRAGPEGSSPIQGHVVVLVAYADPEPSDYMVSVRFTRPGQNPVERVIRMNHPASFDGISFCIVAQGADRYSNEFIGLQMTREPGESVFWGGALLFGLSLIGHFRTKRGKRGETSSTRNERSGGAARSAPAAVGCFLLGILFFPLPGGAFAFGTVISGDQVWHGEVRIAEPVTVEKGATLRIRAGTRVLLSGEDRDGDGCSDGFIQVFGAILVEGEKGRPVRFLRMDPEKPWEEIFLKGASADIRYAVFEGGKWGLHIHDGTVKVEQAAFLANGGGSRLKGKGVVFSRCTFRGNGVGIRFWDGGPKVFDSVIEGNGTGLFYREGSGGGKINGNRIMNRDWNLKVGDWAEGDLDVSRNYWGNGMDGSGFRVQDFRERKETGRIVIAPALKKSPQPCGTDMREER